jgi:hypothetical protein
MPGILIFNKFRTTVGYCFYSYFNNKNKNSEQAKGEANVLKKQKLKIKPF